jgi:battenin
MQIEKGRIAYLPVSIESSCIDDDDDIIYSRVHRLDDERVHVRPQTHVQQQQQQQQQSSPITPVTAFFLLGLLNNIVYVIVLAAAKTISSGGVGLVYTANILPALLVKLSSPLWFHWTSYRARLTAATISALTALTLIGAELQTWKLVGVACVSLQCGLGEATLLALAGKWDANHSNNRKEEGVDDVEEEEYAKDEGDPDPDPLVTTTAPSIAPSSSTTNKATALTAFSSGTGLAGPAGFGWTLFFTQGLQWSLNATALVSLVLPVTYLLLYMVCLKEEDEQSISLQSQSEVVLCQATLNDNNDDNDSVRLLEHGQTKTSDLTHISKEHDPLVNACTTTATVGTTSTGTVSSTASLATATMTSTTNTFNQSKPTKSMTLPERVVFCYHLWPYCVPLFTVYAAEYACQAGAWTAIGFPTVNTSEAARNDFYVAAGWWYQTGVFLSRSSGHLMTVNMTVLWILPALQVWNLILFCYTAAAAGYDDHHNDENDALLASWLYQQPVLLLGAFTTGLLGGAVYVHGYKRITADYDKGQVELALSATSVAEGLGVLVADVTSLFIQSCLYQIHDLSGAIVTCPF